jgi:uncharacterized protein YdcH (DUF465 family)
VPDLTSPVPDPVALIAELAAEHRRLDAQVQALERRKALSPAEQQAYARLKKLRLRAKDRLAQLAR